MTPGERVRFYTELNEAIRKELAAMKALGLLRKDDPAMPERVGEAMRRILGKVLARGGVEMRPEFAIEVTIDGDGIAIGFSPELEEILGL